MQDTPAIVADDKEAVENTERDRWYSEEIHRRSRFPVILKKRPPTLGRPGISRLALPPARDGSLAQHEKVAVKQGAPQVGFSATMRKISSRTSLDSGFLPTCFLTFEITLQYG
jgi:hypothetical protein